MLYLRIYVIWLDFKTTARFYISLRRQLFLTEILKSKINQIYNVGYVSHFSLVFYLPTRGHLRVIV